MADESQNLKNQLTESNAMLVESELRVKTLEKEKESKDRQLGDLELELQKNKQETADLKNSAENCEKRLEDAEHATKVSRYPRGCCNA